MSNSLDDLNDDISSVLETYEPMTTNWVLVLETSTIDSDGDVAGAWGMANRGGQLRSLGLLDIATAYTRASLLDGGEVDD